MQRQLVLGVCLGLLVVGSTPAQEEEEEEYIDPASAAWGIADSGERRLVRYRELQDELLQLGRQQSQETANPQGQPSEQQELVSLSLLTAPKKAKKAYGRAVKELKKKSPDLAKAEDHLNTALREHPELAPAWELLGWVSTYQGNRAEAREKFLRSVESDSRYQSGYIALAHTATSEGRWQEAMQWAERAVNINPSTSRAHFYWAVAAFQVNALDVAAREAQRSLEVPDPYLAAHAHQVLGAVHHRRNDLKAAAEEYRIFLKAEPNHPASARLKKDLADWEAAGVVPEHPARSRARSSHGQPY